MTKKVELDSYRAYSPDTSIHLREAIRMCRYDNLWVIAPGPLGYINEIEEIDGALYRCTKMAFNFGWQMELRCRGWMTMGALLVHGPDLLQVVTERLLNDAELQRLFRACFPANLKEHLLGVVCTPADVPAILSTLQGLVTAKFMRSRSKYFVGVANDRLRKRFEQALTTRMGLRAAGKSTAQKVKATTTAATEQPAQQAAPGWQI